MTFEAKHNEESHGVAVRRGFAPRDTVHIADVVVRFVSTAFVKLPSWMPAGAAAKAARLKRATHVLVDDRGRLSAIPTLRVEQAPPTALLGRYADVTTPAVAADASPGAALAAMDATAAQAALVVSGRLLLGLVAREVLAARLRAGGLERTRHAA